MKNKLRLVAIFAIAMLFSFIPETFPDFFGDWVCQGGKVIVEGNSYDIVGCSYRQQDHMPSTHWGFRHWMWTLCGASLFIWNVVELIDKKYRL
jgi:hypothetical protein